uniref:Uncharacterized protein n=1 Tax=Rhizophora mucronata TaxID=61149 RepID=A0A2P2ILJ2_RHIMU
MKLIKRRTKIFVYYVCLDAKNVELAPISATSNCLVLGSMQIYI